MSISPIDFVAIRKLIDRIPAIKFKMAQERSKAEKMTSVVTGMPHGSGGDRSPVEESAIKLADMEEAYAEILRELDEIREALDPLIDGIEGLEPKHVEQRAMMRLRYIDGYSIPQIANATNRCERRVQQILRDAEKKISLNFTPEEAYTVN